MSLHTALTSVGVDSHVAVKHRTLVNNPKVHQIPAGNALADRVLNAITFRLGWDGISGTASYKLLQQEYFRNADVINLHVLHGGYFNYLAVGKMAQIKPVVLTLHDMWHFTGHCVYSMDCERWKTGCGTCPYPETYPGIQRDSTAFNWKKKKKVFDRPDIHVIAISSWMEDLVKQSLLGDLPLHRIPNGINTEVYHPQDKAMVRQKLGLPSDKTLILYCASDISDRRKGADLLLDSLKLLNEQNRRSMMLLVMGNASDSLRESLSVECRYLGFLTDDREKSEVFSACDVLAFPTRADNLPVVIQEALGCGVPCISFDVGGVRDMVRPGSTGWLCPPESTSDFAAALRDAIVQPDLLTEMSRKCREVACDEYGLHRQGASYKQLFNKLAS